MGILEGKAAVVTGGGRGVGRGECLHLVAQGAAVVVNDVDAEEAKKVVEEMVSMGAQGTPDDLRLVAEYLAQAYPQK